MGRSRKTKWSMQDVLRLELIAHHYENARYQGLRRREVAENHRLLEEVLTKDPDAHQSRRKLLKDWSALKWKCNFENTTASRVLHYGLRIPLVLLFIAFFTGIIVNLSWAAMEQSVHVPSVLLTHALLPFALMLVLLTFGNYFGDGGSVCGLMRRLVGKLRLSGRALNHEIRHTVDRDAEAEGAKHLFAPVMRVYLWLFAKLERILSQVCADSAVETVDGSDEPGFRIRLSDVLGKRSDLLQLWTYLSIQLMVVGYFVGFFVVFLFSLLMKSTAFHWGTSFQSVVSPERLQQFITFVSAPWQRLAAAPTLEQITATQVFAKVAQPSAIAGWEAWAVFLTMAIVCYAILPRSLLCVIQKLRLNARLATDDFAEQRFQLIVDEMTHLHDIQRDPPSAEELADGALVFKPSKGFSGQTGRGRFCLFITDELLWHDQEWGQAEAAALRQIYFTPQDKHHKLALDSSALSTEQFKEKIHVLSAACQPLDSQDRIVFLLDSEQNPKNNLKTRVRSIREALGQKVGVLFLLVHSDHAVEAEGEDSERCRIWSQSIRKWGDADVQVADLIGFDNLLQTDHEL